jgi:hypothetical protein
MKTVGIAQERRSGSPRQGDSGLRIALRRPHPAGVFARQGFEPVSIGITSILNCGPARRTFPFEKQHLSADRKEIVARAKGVGFASAVDNTDT